MVDLAAGGPTDRDERVDRVDPRVERTRLSVLAAAAELMAEIGWGGVTIESVSARSGVARTTIYRHWPDRLALLANAMASVLEPCPEPDTGTLRGDLTVILRGLAGVLTRSASAGVMSAMIDAAEHDPAIARLQDDFTRERRSAARRTLQRAAARGEIGADFDYDIEAALLGGALFYRRLVARQPVSARFVDRVVDAACVRLGAP